MLRFGRGLDEGRCTFADRYQYRLEFTWRRVPGPPDAERMFRDYAASLELAGARADVAPAVETGRRYGAWRGLEVKGPDLCHSRYGRYLPQAEAVVECTFFWPGEPQRDVLEHVLDAVGWEEPATDATRRWRCFAMDFRVGPAVELHACRARPAAVTLEFRNPDCDDATETFERLGLVKHWLEEPVGAWLRRHIPGDVAVESVRGLERGSHRVALLEGTRRRPFRFRGGLRLRVRAAAWTCPEDGRLYCARLETPARMTVAGPAVEDRLVCCPRKASEAARHGAGDAAGRGGAS
jgi:hypothetical protein